LKFIALAILLFCSTLAFAAANPADYPITLHVTASRLLAYGDGANTRVYEHMDVVIDGKKYELEGDAIFASRNNWGVINCGNYKARLTTDIHRADYIFHQTYEILFPDNHPVKFDVTGQVE
jgi:hypothetical protein